jgi:hypothetical protein
MNTFRVLETTGKDGTLSLNIALGEPEAEYEVLVVVQPSARTVAKKQATWPIDFFETTFGIIQDTTFIRPSQGELPRAVEIE